MVVSTGVMRAIARSHPTITLDVLASPGNASIIDGADYVAQVIVFDKKRLGDYLSTAIRLRRARYDAVVDCMVTAPSVTTLLLILASGAQYRVGISGRGNDSAFNVTVPPETRAGAHMVDLLAALAPGVRRRARRGGATAGVADQRRRAFTRRRDVGDRGLDRWRRWSRTDQRLGGFVRATMARRTLRRGHAASATH
jgi:ADP-heptose:LPS heptosyltransferase